MNIFEELNPVEDIRYALIMIALFMFIATLQHTILGLDKNTRPILESAISSLNLIDVGYALASGISDMVFFIALMCGVAYFVIPEGMQI